MRCARWGIAGNRRLGNRVGRTWRNQRRPATLNRTGRNNRCRRRLSWPDAGSDGLGSCLRRRQASFFHSTGNYNAGNYGAGCQLAGIRPHNGSRFRAGNWRACRLHSSTGNQRRIGRRCTTISPPSPTRPRLAPQKSDHCHRVQNS